MARKCGFVNAPSFGNRERGSNPEVKTERGKKSRAWRGKTLAAVPHATFDWGERIGRNAVKGRSSPERICSIAKGGRNTSSASCSNSGKGPRTIWDNEGVLRRTRKSFTHRTS